MNAVFSDTKYTHPLFTLEFNIYGTGAEIRVNDTPTYTHNTEGQTSSQKPIPELIIDGLNSLSIRSFPLDGNNQKYQQGAYIEAIISVREKDAPLNENQPILQLKINPSELEDNVLTGTQDKIGSSAPVLLRHSELETVAERSAQIESPFPRWSWQDGQDIENTTENFESLLKKYKDIWASLNAGDIAKIHGIYDHAAAEFAAAYHYQDKQQGHRIMNTAGLINDPDWKLANIDKFLDKFEYRLEIYANKKLAHIVDQKDRSPIIYLGKKAKIVNIQTYSFYKDKSGEWIMIR